MVAGYVKIYIVYETGNDNNLQFASENDWIADIGSFNSGKPSKLFIIIIETYIILQIEWQDLYFSYIITPKLNHILK